MDATTSSDEGRQFHALEPGEALAALGVDASTGLSEREAAHRLARHGPNDIGTALARGWPAILGDQFRGAIFWLLLAAMALSLWLGDREETVAIAVVLLLNGAIGFTIELRAVRSMQALRALARTSARVRRDGRVAARDASDLVPGDIVLLEAGELVPADLRLIEAIDLACDESTLTGESVPVSKDIASLPGQTPLADRTDMAFRGTSVTRGVGVGAVVGTGAATELGAIAEIVTTVGEPPSPLERRLEVLGRQLAWAAIVAVAGLTALGLAAGHPPVAMIKTAVALAVAAVPEGLPIVATLALARGMWRMARRNALVNRLAAVETLGSVDLILTDKTGTLTENRMTVAGILMPGGELTTAAPDPAAAEVLRHAALCTDTGPSAGDPMERALVQAAEAAFGPLPGLLAATPRTGLRPFDPDLQMMASLHRGEGGVFVAVKGAPEAVIARSTTVRTETGAAQLDAAGRDALLRQAEAEATRGLRLLGVARRDAGSVDADPFAGLEFVGFVALRDPARPDVGAAIRACQQAGLRIVMVTGDHPGTARRIACETGLVADPDARVCTSAEQGAPTDCAIFARVPPRAKLDLVARHQSAGAIVAMIGDGVNDAPALKQADIGIAMGRRGTQVAAEASDIILRDDAFASIVAAVREGRVIYGNIRRFIRYLFSCNLSELLTVTAALLAGLPMPLLPLQILFLNLITDVFPALALGAGGGPADVMRRPPRPPGEPLLGRGGWLAIARDAAVMAVAVLAALVLALAAPETVGLAPTTAAFLSLALAQLWHVFLMRESGEGWLDNQVTRNPWVWSAIALSLALVLAGTYVPPLADALDLAPPTVTGWLVVVGASLGALGVNAGLAALGRRRSPKRLPQTPRLRGSGSGSGSGSG